MQAYNIKNARKKILVGDLVIYLILAVSLGVSIAYWYDFAGFRNSNIEKTGFAFILSFLVVAVGFTTEVVKKVTISMFRHFYIWLFATFVSILTIMGSYSVLDQDKQNRLVTQSDGYKLALGQKKQALTQQAKYAYASSFSIKDLEKQKRSAGKKARWGTFNRLKKDIEAKRFYDSAVATLGLSSQNLNIGGASTSTNPFLDTLAKPLGISGQLLKTIFFLLITLLLESSAFWIGGKVEELKNTLELTEAEILDLKLISMYGVSMSEINAGLFANVVQAQIDHIEAEKQIEIIRRTSRKRLPVAEAVTQIKQIQKQSQDKTEGAKKEEEKPVIPPRPAPSFSAQTAPMITANTAPVFQPKQAKIQPKQAGGFSFDFMPNNPPKQLNENSPNRLKNSLNRRVKHNSPTASNKAGAIIRRTRKTDTPDTGIRGETAQRYRALKKHIQEEIEAGRKKKNKVAISYLRTFKYGTKTVGYQTAKKYHEALKKEGVIS